MHDCFAGASIFIEEWKNRKEQEILLWNKITKKLKFGMLKQNYLIFAFIGCTFLSESWAPLFLSIPPLIIPSNYYFIHHCVQNKRV